jgi:TatD DNase family protein
MHRGTLIDTHTHLYLSQFDDDIHIVIQRAVESGILKMLLPNIDLGTISSMMKLTIDYPDVCHAMMGLHPCSVGPEYIEVLKEMEAMLADGSWIAIGETGVDLYWDTTYQEDQINSFRSHIEWAKEMQIPIVIHSRDSLDLNIGIIEEMQDGRLTGVFHCFNGTVDQGKRIVDAGMMMGLGGVVTFKNAKMKDVLPELSKAHIVLETDAPYLAPVPFRGKRNEPGYMIETAQYLAECLEMSYEKLALLTTRNALRLFHLEDSHD